MEGILRLRRQMTTFFHPAVILILPCKIYSYKRNKLESPI